MTDYLWRCLGSSDLATATDRTTDQIAKKRQQAEGLRENARNRLADAEAELDRGRPENAVFWSTLAIEQAVQWYLDIFGPPPGVELSTKNGGEHKKRAAVAKEIVVMSEASAVATTIASATIGAWDTNEPDIFVAVLRRLKQYEQEIDSAGQTPLYEANLSERLGSVAVVGNLTNVREKALYADPDPATGCRICPATLVSAGTASEWVNVARRIISKLQL